MTLWQVQNYNRVLCNELQTVLFQVVQSGCKAPINIKIFFCVVFVTKTWKRRNIVVNRTSTKSFVCVSQTANCCSQNVYRQILLSERFARLSVSVDVLSAQHTTPVFLSRDDNKQKVHLFRWWTIECNTGVRNVWLSHSNEWLLLHLWCCFVCA